MEETLATEVTRAARSGAPLAIVMCDIDHFKRFNDEFGHQAGDTILHAVASEIGRHFRGGDVACRYGGEEFALVSPGASIEQIEERVEGLRQSIAALTIFEGAQMLGPVTMSFGIARWSPALGPDAAPLICRADSALYKAKANGRNCAVVDCEAQVDAASIIGTLHVHHGVTDANRNAAR